MYSNYFAFVVLYIHVFTYRVAISCIQGIWLVILIVVYFSQVKNKPWLHEFIITEVSGTEGGFFKWRGRRDHFLRNWGGGDNIFHRAESEKRAFPQKHRGRRENFSMRWEGEGANSKLLRGRREHFQRRERRPFSQKFMKRREVFPRSWEIGRSIFQEVGREEGPFSTESREKGWNIFQGVEKEEETFSNVLIGSRDHFSRC